MPEQAAIEQLILDVGAEAAIELYDVFKADAEMRLREIRARMNSNDDLIEFKRHAHSLKGVCHTYGLPRSGELAFALEQAISNEDHDQIIATANAVLEHIPDEITKAVEMAAALSKTPL